MLVLVHSPICKGVSSDPGGGVFAGAFSQRLQPPGDRSVGASLCRRRLRDVHDGQGFQKDKGAFKKNRDKGEGQETVWPSFFFTQIPEADLYVSMGCNVACPNIPGKTVINWGLEDPTGKDDSAFLGVIRQIEQKVRGLREGD